MAGQPDIVAAAATRWFLLIIIGYLFAGLTIFALTLVFMDTDRLAAVWDHERAMQARASGWTPWRTPETAEDTREQTVLEPALPPDENVAQAAAPDAPPHIECWSRALTVALFRHVLPRPSATRAGLATQVSAVVQSSFGTDPSGWYGTTAYPNLWYYLPLVCARALGLLGALIVAMPLILPVWFLGQSQARTMLREAVLPKTHRFRWYRLAVYCALLSTCTWIFVPLPVSAVVVAPLLILLLAWGVNRIRVHGIEL